MGVQIPVAPRVALHVRISQDVKDDWRGFCKKSSTWLAGVMAATWAIMPEVANQWPSAAPFILHYFPKAGENIAPFIGSILFILARVSKFEFIRKARDAQ